MSDSLLHGRLVRNFGKAMSLFETKDLFYLFQVYLKNTKKKLSTNYLRLGDFLHLFFICSCCLAGICGARISLFHNKISEPFGRAKCILDKGLALTWQNSFVGKDWFSVTFPPESMWFIVMVMLIEADKVKIMMIIVVVNYSMRLSMISSENRIQQFIIVL